MAAAKSEAPESGEAPELAVFTAPSGVLFHDTDVHFTHDQDRQAPGSPRLYSFTAFGAATAQKVRDLAAAEPQWGIKEVSE